MSLFLVPNESQLFPKLLFSSPLSHVFVILVHTLPLLVFVTLFSLICFDCIGRCSTSLCSQLTSHPSVTSSAAADEVKVGMETRRVQQLWIIDVGQEGDVTREDVSSHISICRQTQSVADLSDSIPLLAATKVKKSDFAYSNSPVSSFSDKAKVIKYKWKRNDRFLDNPLNTILIE